MSYTCPFVENTNLSLIAFNLRPFPLSSCIFEVCLHFFSILPPEMTCFSYFYNSKYIYFNAFQGFTDAFPSCRKRQDDAFHHDFYDT